MHKSVRSGRKEYLRELHRTIFKCANFFSIRHGSFFCVLFIQWWPVRFIFGSVCVCVHFVGAPLTMRCELCDFVFVLVSDRVRCTFFLSLVPCSSEPKTFAECKTTKITQNQQHLHTYTMKCSHGHIAIGEVHSCSANKHLLSFFVCMFVEKMHTNRHLRLH